MIWFWFCVVLYIMLFVIGVNYFYKKEGYISTFTVFAFAGFFYYLAVPIECALTNNDYIILGEIGDQPLQDSTKIAISIMAVLAIIGFGIGLKISKFSFRDKNLKPIEGQKSQPLGISTFIFIAIFLLVLLFRDKIIMSGSYEGNVDAVYNNPLYSLLVDLVVIYCAVLGGSVIIKHRKITFIAILYVLPGIYWGTYASTKDQILVGILGLLTYYTVVKPPKRIIVVLLGLICLVFLAPLGMLWFSLFRAGVNISYEEMKNLLDQGVLRNTDPAGPIAVFNDIYNKNSGYKYGTTYVETLYLWIPKFVWPGRPPNLAEKYAQDTIKTWLPGQGLGYSLLVEGYINLSFIGVVIQYFLIGFLWGKGWGLIKSFISKISEHIWLSLYAIYGFLLLIVIHRAPFSDTPKQMFLMLFPMLLFLLIFKKSSWLVKNVNTQEHRGLN
jgi:oligosaccharide repeat unit polymerase